MDKNEKFNTIIEDIRSVKIQGATNVSRAAIAAYLLKSDKESVKKILRSRPTEPLMFHAIEYLFKSKDPKRAARKFLSYISHSEKKIATLSQKLIKNNMNIYSHCHSSTVIDILKYAKNKKKRKFVVYTTEVEPLLQGRKTAMELAEHGINVIVFPDLAAEQAMKKCDIFLFGADAITKKGIANKIGTATLCEIAKANNIPRYSCATSLKFTESKLNLEMRKPSELWHEHIKRITEQNPAFDFVRGDLVSGIACEFGVIPFKKFVKKSKENLKKFK